MNWMNRRCARSVYLASLVGAMFLCALVSQGQDQTLSPEKRSQIEAAVSRFMASTHVPACRSRWSKTESMNGPQALGSPIWRTISPLANTRCSGWRRSRSHSPRSEQWSSGNTENWNSIVQSRNTARLSRKNPLRSRPARSWDTSAAFATTNRNRRKTQRWAIRSTSTTRSRLASTSSRMIPWSQILVPTFTIRPRATRVVGCVIEGASGSSYLDYMRQKVLLPAGMEHTQADDRFAIIPYRTRFYQKTKSGALQNADFLDSSYKIPGGGWLSSAEDMAHFEVAMLDDKLIKRATRDLMWTPLSPRMDRRTTTAWDGELSKRMAFAALATAAASKGRAPISSWTPSTAPES